MDPRVWLATGLLILAAGPLAAFETVPLLVADGRIYVEAVLVDDDGVEHEGLFLVDTGTTSSFVLTPQVATGAWAYERSQVGSLTIQWGMTTLYGSASTSKKLTVPGVRLGTVSLHDWPFLEFPSVPGWEPGTVTAGGRTRPILGMLGADVLFRGSFYLSLSRREMGWTEDPPFRGSQSWELVPTSDPVPIYRMRGTFAGAEGGLFLVDTGSVADQLAPETLQDLAPGDPRHWLRLVTEGGTSVTGLWEGPAPLRSGTLARHVAAIPELGGAGYQILGTETLSAWDLWFRKTGLASMELHGLPALASGRQAFVDSIVWPDWGFPTALRGLQYDPSTQAVVGLYQWGDGTPLIPGLELGDTLVTLPDATSDFLVWRRPDGTEVTAEAPRHPLFP